MFRCATVSVASLSLALRAPSLNSCPHQPIVTFTLFMIQNVGQFLPPPGSSWFLETVSRGSWCIPCLLAFISLFFFFLPVFPCIPSAVNYSNIPVQYFLQGLDKEWHSDKPFSVFKVEEAANCGVLQYASHFLILQGSYHFIQNIPWNW